LTTGRSTFTRLREPIILAAIVVAMAIVALLARRSGHWWGDDWALYVRQAEGLVQFRPGEVIADNRFTVEQSGLPEFSPPVYPWGYPIVLAPFVAVLGTDLDRLMLAQIFCFGWFLVMWHRLARPRVGAVLALVGTGVLALSPQYLRWSELIQSELAFIAVAATALVVLDRERTRATLVAVGSSLWPLVGVGVAAAAAFSVRREGLAMLPAIFVTQAAALALWWRALGPTERASLRSNAVWARLAGRLAVPYAAMATTIALLQVVLPSTLVPRYQGNGIHNVWGFASDHLGHVLATLGLRHAVDATPTVLGNETLGTVMVVVFLATVAAGVLRAAWKRPALDLPLVAFMAAAITIGGSFRFPGSRYLAVVGPIALLLAISGCCWVVRLVARRSGARAGGTRAAVVTTAVLLVLMLVANADEARHLIDRARAAERAGTVEWGPDAPDSIDMFAAVSTLTDDDAVIGFFKARAMTQRTERRALQIGAFHPIERVDHLLTHMVLERASPLAGEVSTDPDRFEPIWSNPTFTLYQFLPPPTGTTSTTSTTGN
jgi:hypothetical protein